MSNWMLNKLGSDDSCSWTTQINPPLIMLVSVILNLKKYHVFSVLFELFHVIFTYFVSSVSSSLYHPREFREDSSDGLRR